jgi:hypothetical protein
MSEFLGPLLAENYLAEIANAGPEAQAQAQVNLGIDTNEIVTSHYQDFNVGTDFTAGTTQILTFDFIPINATILQIFFDGVNQAKNTWTLSGSVVTFAAPIPVGVEVVEVQGISSSTTGTMSTQSDNAVSITGGTVSANVSASTVLTTGTTTARTLAARAADISNVLDYGADNTGATVVNTAVQAAANAIASTGGILLIPPGSYLWSGTVSLKSLTTVQMYGAVLTASPSWPNNDSAGAADLAAGTCFFQNVNYTATVLTDHDITIEGGFLKYGSYVTASSHGIGMRFAQHIRILNVRMDAGANGTAFLACDDVLTQGCIATNQQNCCFDHWEGSTNIRVIGNHCVMSSASGTGIQVSGLSTLGTAGTSSTITISGNTVIGNVNATVGITVNALGATSVVNGAAIGLNTLVNCGIYCDGPGHGHTVTGNTLDGATVGILFRDVNGTLMNCTMTGNVINGASVTAGNVGPVHVEGTGHTVSGNRISGGSWNVGMYIPGSNCSIMGNVIDSVTGPSGPSAPYNNTGSDNIILHPNITTGYLESRQPFAFGSGLTILSDGSGAPTSSTPGYSTVGAIYINQTGSVGTRLYMSYGGGWSALAGL